MAGSFLKDVAYRNTKSATCVYVPTPQAGTYDENGIRQAICATLWLPKGRMTPNKKQDDASTRGWCTLSPDHIYTVSWTERENSSIHADNISRKLKLTGAQIVAANEEFGRPAIKKQNAAKTKTNPSPAQLRLFDDDYAPTYETAPCHEEKEPTTTEITDARTPIAETWDLDTNLFYDHDVEF